MGEQGGPEQPVEPVETPLPVARVLVDLPLAHLDRPFDYEVPAALDECVVPGGRVRVRFAGRDVGAFVLERLARSDHPGRLAAVRRAVSAEAVLTPEVARLCESVARRYAGTRADVLRLAVPARHARTEGRPSPDAVPPPDPDDALAWWAERGPGGPVAAGWAAGESGRVVWTVPPGGDWAAGMAAAATAVLASGRGAVLCAPDRRDLERLDAALTGALGEGRHVVLAADMGPAARYRAFLAAARGAVQVVAGTRAAGFAPVRDLGLVALWDDGDDGYAEPRAPYPHTREVLLLRAHQAGCGALLAATARSVECEALLESGWATGLVTDRTTVRVSAPQVSVTGATDRELERDPAARASRLPSTAHAAIRDALQRGPVLVQTPRAGYAPALACDSCRAPARCATCEGPLHQPRAHRAPTCRWCGAAVADWRCPECRGQGLRAPVVGERRTAEELGRAFPRVPVRRASADHPLDAVGPSPALVVATPGSEPVAEGGYAAVLLLDTWLPLSRPDLRSAEEAVRRWFNAAALARTAADGGRVVAVGDPSAPALQALVRWDPAGFAAREAAERRAAHLPPASRLAVINGVADDVEAFLAALELPLGAEVLGPVEATGRLAPQAADDEPVSRVVVRVPRRYGGALSDALRSVQGVRSARKLPLVRVQIDPPALA